VVAEAVVVLLIVAVFVASRIDLPYYAISPGSASAVDPKVTVPSAQSHKVHGSILLTDVVESRVTALSYIPDKLRSDTDVLPQGEILGPSTPPDQLADQGFLQMAQSQAAAKAAALTRLGYQVTERNVGTLINAVEPGSPASGVLSVAQIVTAVGSVPTTDLCSFVGAVHGLEPGTTVTLQVEQSTVTSTGTIRPGPVLPMAIRVGRAPRDLSSSGCPGVAGPSRAYLGVEVTTQQDFTYPIQVSVDTTNIGGPSAGLAMTLGIMDRLSSGNLTGGATIAATGTIDPQGDVGPVGGLTQKTIAVQRAGAKAFLVPAGENYTAAKAAARPGLRVFSVSTLSQALADLQTLGGQIPAAPGQPA
jgi:PDZ domain-containing protein